MASRTQYLEYTIHLTDKAEAAALQAQYPDGIRLAPAQAAIDYAAPIQTVSQDFDPPCTRSPLFIIPILLPTTLTNYPRHVATFTRKSGGWFGLSFLFGDTTTYVWVGKFAYAPPPDAQVDGAPAEVVAIAKRLWLIGFEGADATGNMFDMVNTGGNSNRSHPLASRHTDGMGLLVGSGATEYAADRNASGTADATKTWERFYIQLLNAPDANTRFWRCLINGGANRGCAMYMTPDRRIIVTNISDAGAETVAATTSRQFDAGDDAPWYRLDLLIDSAGAAATLGVYVNGAEEMTVASWSPAATGMLAGGVHLNSYIGTGGGGLGTNRMIMCVDDWIGSEFPTEDSNGDYVGLDWLNGSRVRAIPATAFATGNNFAGDYRYAGRWRNTSNLNGPALTTSTSGDALRLLMDEELVKSTPGSLGVVAFMVAVYGRNQVSGQGTLGWKYNGVIDLAAQSTGPGASGPEGGNPFNWYRRWFCPSGLTEPIPDAELLPFELHKVKALDTNLAEYYAGVWLVEMIGVFGQCDVSEDETEQPTTIQARRGLHNSYFPTTRWAQGTIAPSSPVIIHTGTYVGTGTAIELTFRSNVNWLMIQSRSGGAAQLGGFWWTSMIGGHAAESGHPSGFPLQVIVDPSFVPVDGEDNQEQRVVVRIVGNANGYNNTGVTYQYVAFMDPGSRFSANMAYHMPTAAWTPVGSRSWEIPNHSTFVPEWGFYHEEVIGGLAGAVSRHVKGPGHTADQATSMSGGAVLAAGARHLAGSITILASLVNATNSRASAVSLWRDDDQSADENRHRVVKIGTYTGDGAASRTITFATSGLRPVYGIVQPAAAPAYHRTPADLALSSSPMDGAVPTNTGITGGGIDSFTVGSTLNANGVVYNYFMLLGSATAGNGGWSVDGEFSVLEPDVPFDGDWGDGGDSVEPDPDTPTDPDPDPGPSDEDDCLAGDVCIAATTREVNRALLEIGNTKFLTNYCTQQTLEARTARLLYESSVRSVLHAFPWPFATKYATLALAATQPTNEDWDFAYRQPVDCIFERRLVVDRGTGVDPKGPGFELSSDASGGLILTNEPNAVLEYTCRPPCVAFVGDALFKEALKWHLAEAFASPLTRMTDKGPYCRVQYEAAIAKANAIIKPGQPGLRDTPDPAGPDAAAACIAANVQVVNVALVRIGANTIANLATEQSREAVAANLIFEHELRATLRDYPWKFAKRYNTAALTLVGGTASTPVNHDWQYSYRLPDDYVSVRRLPTTGTGRSFERHPNTFEVGSDDTGYLLFTGLAVENVNLEYTARIDCCVARADDLFRDALAWRLAYSLAASLAQVDPEKEESRGRGPVHPPDPTQRISHKPNEAAMRERMQRWAFGQYLRAIEKARVADANEAEPEPHGEAEWIEGRN